MLPLTFHYPIQQDAIRSSGQPDYFNTAFLSNYDLVKTCLQAEGFQEGLFKSDDGLNINYVFLNRPEAICNIILCCGWLPGRKEGLASFYKILPEHCNLLFFDARGHGSSQGPLFSKIWEYGMHEYKDIIGAITFVHKQNNLPIILYGTCAGAFHAAHAVIKLHEQGRIEQLQIKGLVFDSGWASVTATSCTTPQAWIKELILKGLAKVYGSNNYRELKTTLPYKITSTITDSLMSVVHYVICKPCLWFNEHNTNLFDKIERIKIPVLFIHAQDDDYTSISDVKKLAQLVDKKTCWWIKKESKHACHHLKHKTAYTKRIYRFLNNIQ